MLYGSHMIPRRDIGKNKIIGVDALCIHNCYDLAGVCGWKWYSRVLLFNTIIQLSLSKFSTFIFLEEFNWQTCLLLCPNGSKKKIGKLIRKAK